jgi:carbon starvation protein
MNSMWLVLTAFAAFAVAYRFYGAFLTAKVAVLDNNRLTPAHRLRDGVDYHPTNKYVLFGHHFAAIAGPGPLIGPVLAAQWGYLPGFIWIIIGACLAGAVHDFVTLWASVREDGMSLSKIARNNIGPVSGVTTSVATLFIVIAILSSVALVVVKALGESSWGVFTIVVTIPAALLTGLWMYKIRPGKVGEASAIGVTIVFLGVFLGKPFAGSSLGHILLFEETTLKVMLPAYAVIASILPVWVLMCPRDYLSSYLKIGVIAVLAVGIVVAHPTLKMPATTYFTAGGGPNNSGTVWPFVCIVIMCGALSGFHALIASGTTPKMIYRERDVRPIGYGAMVLEGFVALTALVAACALEPGDYFKINVPLDNDKQPTAYLALAENARTQHGWNLNPVEFDVLEAEINGTPVGMPVKEKLAGRTGGAVTLAVGMAKVFSNIPGMKQLMAYWYHFVIMFEALFILTLLETGTRVARFVFQETVAQFSRTKVVGNADAERKPATADANEPDAHNNKDKPKRLIGKNVNWTRNVVMSFLTCAAWGGLLYIGDISTLWRMLGIANQLLAAIALGIGTTYILLHAPKRIYALCTFIPFVAVLVTVFVAGILSIQGWWGEIGTIAPGPGRGTQVFLRQLMCGLTSALLILTVAITADATRRWRAILARPTAAKPSKALAAVRPLAD